MNHLHFNHQSIILGLVWTYGSEKSAAGSRDLPRHEGYRPAADVPQQQKTNHADHRATALHEVMLLISSSGEQEPLDGDGLPSLTFDSVGWQAVFSTVTHFLLLEQTASVQMTQRRSGVEPEGSEINTSRPVRVREKAVKKAGPVSPVVL